MEEDFNGVSIEVGELEIQPSNVLLGVGVPCSFTHIHLITSMTFAVAMCDAQTKGIRQHLIQEGNGPLDDLRNNIVKSAKNIGCSHLIMCDMDMVYPPDTFHRLLSKCNEDTPIVGGLCFKRYPPFSPVMMRGIPSRYRIVEEWKDGEFLEVDATGTGCIMLHMSVFDKMEFPWFKFGTTEEYGIKVPGLSAGTNVGEDIGFCFKARKLGIPVYIDTALEIGHNTTLTVDRNTWELWKKLKGNTDEAMEKKKQELSEIYEPYFFEQ